MTGMNEPTIVWDSDAIPNARWQRVLLWRSYAESASGESIPRYLDEHAEALRARHLAFIYALGQQQLDGRTLIQHFDRGDGFSFWWMTHLAEKSPFKSPRLYDCLRLLALEEMLVKSRPAALILHSGDVLLAQAFGNLCRKLGISFSLARLRKADEGSLLRRLYQALPWRWRGLLSLRHMLRRWPLRALARPKWFSGTNGVFLCSYFFNLDAVAAEQGHFHSRQWESLPAYLHRSGKCSNWIHHMLLTPTIPDIATGLRWATQFNKHRESEGCHSFVESQISWRLLARALLDWLWLGHRANNITRHLDFTKTDPGTYLWPLLRDDWNTSLRGPAALSNCLWVHLFDQALAAIPHQPKGLYLWENQGWEAAFLHAWRRHGHGTVIGVPHATTAFWHLNNFDDMRVIAAQESSSKPLPDYLAVNGPMAWRMFTNAGYPSDRLLPVEALRFQYLAKRVSLPRPETEQTGRLGICNILILGDFTRRQTFAMLACLAAAAPLVKRELRFTLKPHPVNSIDPGDVPNLPLQITTRPLDEILDEFDLAFSSNSSSAGLDALLFGLPVIIFLDDSSLNHSPLRGVSGTRFVSSAEELADGLSSIKRDERVEPKDFFWLDDGLPRWRAVINQV